MLAPVTLAPLPATWAAPPPPAPPPADAPRDTPYQRIKNSPAGKFVRENKLTSVAAGVGTAIVVGGGVSQSDGFAHLARYAIAPAVGAGVAVLGAAAVHDAIVNDLGKHNGRAAVKASLGTLGALGGTQTVGMAYGIPVLDHALTTPLSEIVDHGQMVLGVGVLGGAAAAGKFAANRLQAAVDHKEHRGANAALGVVSTGAAAGGVLGGLELIGRQYHVPGMDRLLTDTVEFLSRGGPAAAGGGALLIGGAAVLADEAVQNLRKGGNDLVTVVEGMGAASTGLGGLELVGRGLKIAPLEGLLTKHAELVGATAATAGGAALVKMSIQDARANGLRLRDGAGVTVGSSMTLGGVAVAADSFGLSQASTAIGNGAEATAGAGLALTSYILGRDAVNHARHGEVGSAAVCGVASVGAGTASLATVGNAFHIEAISRLGREVADHTLVPLFDHVIEPTARFLFENPVAGAVVIAVGVGTAYAWYRHKHQQP